MTKIFKVCSLLSLSSPLWLRLPLRIDVSRASLSPRCVRSYRISRESFFPCQNIALLPDLIYPVQLCAPRPDLAVERFRAISLLPVTQPPARNSSGYPVTPLLQVGGRGLESFCAVHVRCDARRERRGEIDLRPKKAINRTNNAAAPRPANEKRLPACVVRPCSCI